jgi:hypothetical protein
MGQDFGEAVRLYNGEETEGIGEHDSKLLMLNEKYFASANAHANKKNAKRRHANHLIWKGFSSILRYFGASVSMAQIGAFGSRRNNGFRLYIGERSGSSPRPNHNGARPAIGPRCLNNNSGTE